MAEKLNPATIIAMRYRLELTQTKFAHLLGMSLGAYQKIENGVSAYRLIHKLAAERICLDEAARRDDYGLLADPALEDIQKLYGGRLPETASGLRRTFLRHCDLLEKTFEFIVDSRWYTSDGFTPDVDYVTFDTLPKLARLIADPGIDSQKLVPNVCALRLQVLSDPKTVSAGTLRDAQADVLKILNELSEHPDKGINTAPAKARALYRL